jgi:hypothetical protein
MTNPAAVTESMGLPAYPQLSWFLHHHFESFIMTGQILPILHKCTFDTYSLTSKLLPPIGTMQKLIPALTLTATNPNHRAVSTNISVCDDYALAPFLKCFVLTRYFVHLYRDTPLARLTICLPAVI